MNKKVLIAGGTGLIGKRLSEMLIDLGWKIHILSRKKQKDSDHIKYFLWDLEKMTIDDESTNVSAIINLTGAGIADARWTKKRKEMLISSRVDAARLIKQSLEGKKHKPIYVSASAVGFYGNRGEEALYESSKKGVGFMADCCHLWEEAAFTLTPMVDRLVVVRVGLVLSKKGGALPKILMTKPILSYFGNGEQYYPWIHIDDICEIFIESINDIRKRGIYNACVEKPLTNKALIQEVKKVVGGVVVPAPEFALKLAMGEMANVVLNSNRVIPKRLKEEGFTWKYPDLKSAMENMIKYNK